MTMNVEMVMHKTSFVLGLSVEQKACHVWHLFYLVGIIEDFIFMG
jgi:hypothetical protein